MRGATSFIAVDWGTTNRRAWRMDAAGGCSAEMEDDQGILAVGAGGFGDAVAAIRRQLGDHPMLMAGMVGSNRGWIEAPYVSCPAGLDELTAKLIWAEEGRTAIVPGLSHLTDDAADVMRGEEVQIFGAHEAGLTGPDCMVCHPGTHNKWARVSDGRVVSFRTVMTGELFSLLKEHSILSDLLAGPVEDGPAFRAGVRRGLEQELVTAELFGVRAGFLLGRLGREEAAPFTSGLLIGADVKAGLAAAPDAELVIMGRPDLTSLYAGAAEEAGRSARQVDGETAFLQGIRAIAERIG